PLPANRYKRPSALLEPPPSIDSLRPPSPVRPHPEKHLPLQEPVQPVILRDLLSRQVVAVSRSAGSQLGVGVAARKVLGPHSFDVVLQLDGVLENHAPFPALLEEILEAAQE